MHKKHEIHGFFLQFFESFRGKIYKKYIPEEIKNESETVTILSDYVVT